jgi:hydrogenase maturation protease
MNQPRILIAGVGNIFFGDDAFGVEVVKRLAARAWPAGVRIVDFGIRGLDLAYAILDGCESVILVDAISRGQRPGTLYLLEPQDDDDALSGAEAAVLADAHGMHPANVLRLVRQLGGPIRPIYVVGCEPAPFDPEHDLPTDLSGPVAASLDDAVNMIESLVERILASPAQTGNLSLGAV